MLSIKKSLSLDGLIGKSHQTLKKKVISILHKFCQKIEEKGTFPNSFYEPIIPLMQKSERKKELRTRKLQTNIPHQLSCKNP